MIIWSYELNVSFVKNHFQINLYKLFLHCDKKLVSLSTFWIKFIIFINDLSKLGVYFKPSKIFAFQLLKTRTCRSNELELSSCGYPELKPLKGGPLHITIWPCHGKFQLFNTHESMSAGFNFYFGRIRYHICLNPIPYKKFLIIIE